MRGSDYHRVEQAIRYLARHAEAQPSLEELAGFLGLSEFHCHRLFRKWAGITPKDFLQVITLCKAKSLLTDSRSVLDTSLSVGLTGPSRLHDLFIRYEAMTPGEYRNGGLGLSVSWTHFESPLGNVTLARTEKGICHLGFAETRSESARRHRLSGLHALAEHQGGPGRPQVMKRSPPTLTARRTGRNDCST